MHNSKLLQSLSFQNGTGFSDFSPTAKECARGFRAARHFLPPQLFFLSFFSNPPKFCPNLSGKLPKSVCSFSRILHRRFSSPSTSNQNPGRRQRGQRQQRQRTEIQEHRNRGGSHRHGCANPRWTSSSPSVEAGVSEGDCAIGRRAAAMSPYLRQLSVGTRSHCVPFCHHQFQGQPILIPLQQKQTNFDKFCYRIFDKMCFWEGFGRFCFSSANSTNFTNFGNFLEKIQQFFLIIKKKNPAPPRFFFQFCDIEKLLILANLVDFILKKHFSKNNYEKSNNFCQKNHFPPSPQKVLENR